MKQGTAKNGLAFIMTVKSADNYTEEEIIELMTHVSNSYEYDCLMDRLYFTDNKPKDKHYKSQDNEILTARVMNERSKKELLRTNIDDLPV